MYNDKENVERIIANEIANKTENNINIENLFMINQYLHEKKTDLEFYNKFFKLKYFPISILASLIVASSSKYKVLCGS